jgi:CheY-like chemotaxis protein
MKIVADAAEHHFLTFLEKLKINASGWIACTFPFSRKYDHAALMGRRAYLKQDLERVAVESANFIDRLTAQAPDIPHSVAYRFADQDCIYLCCPRTEAEQKHVKSFFETLAKEFPPGFCDYGFLTKEIYVYQKLADHKLLTRQKIAAYHMLGEDSMIESLSFRRKKRDEPILLVVEDDRFTASYLAGFLKDFDIIVARSGEEAIQKYIEYAPDAVFLDIHLPGLNGHQTLQAIKCADPDAFVVMLSVDTARNSIMAASENGAVSYLKKPFTRERVLNTLRLSPFIRASQGILPIHRA